MNEPVKELAEVLKRLDEAKPSDGFWYYVRFPGGKWSTLVYRYDRPSSTLRETHQDFWVQEVVPELSKAWALGRDEMKELENHPYAFPRGRLTKEPSRWVMGWGNNIPKGAPFSKSGVESLFDLQSGHNVKWEYDAHEVCNQASKEIVRQMFGIEEDWLAEAVMAKKDLSGRSMIKS